MTTPNAILSDFSRTLLLPLDASYVGGLNALHAKLVEENPAYDPWQYFRINDELFPLFEQLGGKIPLYVFTSNYIQDYPLIRAKLDAVFDDVLSAATLASKKDDPTAYTQLAERVGLQPGAILFIDDSVKNVRAARAAGMEALVYGQDDVVARLDMIVKELS